MVFVCPAQGITVLVVAGHSECVLAVHFAVHRFRYTNGAVVKLICLHGLSCASEQACTDLWPLNSTAMLHDGFAAEAWLVCRGVEVF